ncbi:MAG: lipopolysaccharide/colanic/teichoic acid biosynthesis glycosyltransferase [Glaciecola sp.]|jgi:lipopolysaccharide/colanic/teichoic acid biosynthesis glycosyltransferase
MPSSSQKDRPTAWSSILSMFRRNTTVPGALGVEELAQAFQQERSRTDRNGRGFCMVVFWKDDQGDQSDQGEYDLRPLAKHLRSLMRLYDLLGSLDSKHLAVLLPETMPQGARQFAENSLRVFKDSKLNTEHGIQYEICSYPLEPEASPDKEEWAESREDRSKTPKRGSELVAPAQAQDLSEAFVQPISWRRRTIDVLVSGSSLILLSPVLILAALAVRLSTPGPAIYTQLRAGPGGAPFKFYKFRSMYLDADARKAALKGKNEKTGPIFKMKNDPRITPVGRYLRKTSIDELPQLLNVLLGNMTLIGPRPPTLDEVENYSLWQRKRLDRTGGITCIWQVSGRSEIKFEEWVRMDIEYQQKRSFWFDLKLVLKTFGAVFSGRGAY